MPRLIFSLFLGALLALVPVIAQETRPNFVILLADDLGINDLGCFGRKDQNTPNLDKLATEGARFTSAYAAASVCSASRAALLTGQSPARLNITTFLPGRSDRASHRLMAPILNNNLPVGVQTIAELLKAKGYATGAVGKWHLGGKGHQPTDHGFDEYFAGKANPGAESPMGGKGELGHADYAVKFIERNKAKPFFLYLAFDNPHIPLAAPAKGIEANAKAFHPTYAALVESLDVACGRVLKALEDNGLSKNTFVVFSLRRRHPNALDHPLPGAPCDQSDLGASSAGRHHVHVLRPRENHAAHHPGFPRSFAGPFRQQTADRYARSLLASASLHESRQPTRRRDSGRRLETNRVLRDRTHGVIQPIEGSQRNLGSGRC
ncbi:MAG: hypothetical protein EBU04_02140 [Verrucomicrobia bacterium]|nr:hypothetical protein [Verrucomicrobiota bacterium]